MKPFKTGLLYLRKYSIYLRRFTCVRPGNRMWLQHCCNSNNCSRSHRLQSIRTCT